MAVTTKKTFDAVGSGGQSSTTVFTPVSIELNNQDDLDVYVTLSGGTRVLNYRQSTGSTTDSNHPQVNDTTGLYFPAQSAGVTLYNYILSTDNNTITFNSALPTGAVVSIERRTRDSSSDYTNFVGGSTIRHTDVNKAFDESNFTAQEARNKAFEIEGKIFGTEATSTSFITSDEIVDGTIVDADINASAQIAVNKLADGSARQVLQTASNGSDVEWTSNIDVPGTLDVTGATTLDSNVTVGGTLGVTGTTTAAAINASGAVGVDGDFDVNTNKFTVAASSGNTTVAGTLAAGTTTVTGNIAVSGTVDGRDVAADGTKLDTIEASATADQTNAEIRAAVEAASDSNVFTDADHSKLNAIEASATADQTASEIKTLFNSDGIVNAQIDASAAIAGTKISPDFGSQNVDTTGNILLDSDSNKLKIGDDEDLEIYHNGSNSYVDNTGTGQLFIRSDSGVSLMSETSPSQNYVVCTDGGSVALYFNAAEKIRTGTNGVIVTGTCDINGNLDVSGGVTLPTDSISTDYIADAELKTLAGMQSGTASILASGTALTSTTAELNLLDGKSIVTTISASPTDVQIPTAQAVDERITTVLTDVGGFVPIANETSFPTANPDVNDAGGTIVSIKALSSAFTTGSGVTTKVFTDGAGSGNDVTITGLTQSTTYPAGRGMLVETTSTLHTYTFHRLTLDETGVADAQAAVDDFDERYYGGVSSNPATKPGGGNRTDGDLYFDTSENKMKVFNGSHASGSWDDVATPGDFFINTISSYSGTGGNSATFNGSAYRFVLSNAGNAAQQHVVSINGVIQKPNSGTSQPSEGFVIDGSSIIFSNAPATGSDYFILTLGSSVNIGTPTNNTVSTDKIQNLAVTGDKIATNLDLADNKKIRFGTGNDLSLYHDGSKSYLANSTGNLEIQNGSNSIDLKANGFTVKNGADNETMLTVTADGAVELYHNNSKKLETYASGCYVYGKVALQGSEDGNAIIEMFADEGDDAADKYQLASITNGNWELQNYSSGSSWETNIRATGGGAVSLFYNDAKKFETDPNGVLQGDNSWHYWGDSDDLYIGHNGTDSYIVNTQGSLYIKDETQIVLQTDILRLKNEAGDESYLAADLNGAVELRYDNVKKFETTSSGVVVSGVLEVNGGDVDFSDHLVLSTDSKKLKFGAGEDLEIYHDGTTNWIDAVNNHGTVLRAGTGILYLQGSEIHMGDEGGNEVHIKTVDNGRVELYHDNIKKFETTSTGATVSGEDITLTNTAASGDASLYMTAGEGGSAQVVLYADEGDNATDKFRILVPDSDGIQIQGYNGSSWEKYLKGEADTVHLYYDDAEKFKTRSDGTQHNGKTYFYGHNDNVAGNGNVIEVWFDSDDNHDGIHFKGQGTTTNTFKACNFEISGTGGSYGSITYTTSGTGYNSNSSDRRSKKNFEDWTGSVLPDFKAIKPQLFNYTLEEDSVAKHKGYIAQDNVAAFPEAYPLIDDRYMFNPSGMVHYLMKAVQELTEKVETLETKVAALEAK